MVSDKYLPIIIVLLCMCLLASCNLGGVSSEAKAAADKALVSLRKMDNAAELKLGFVEYRTRLVETKAEVENALPKIPDGELKKEISLALDAYVDMMRVMEQYEKEQAIFGGTPDPSAAFGLSIIILHKDRKTETDLAQVLTQKYGVKAEEKPDSFIIYLNEAKGALYKAGRAHIDHASSLLAK